jgi:hypothetical protein
MKKITQKYQSCLLVLTFLAISFLPACKKNSEGGDASSEYYLTATIDGKEWKANITNGQSSVAAGLQSSIVLVLGLQKEGNDTTAIIVAFPENITLNQPVSINPAKSSVAGYVTVTSGFSTDPSKGGSGTMTITGYDKEAKIVEGTFSGTAVKTVGTPSGTVTIANGKFRAFYELNKIPATPPSLKR